MASATVIVDYGVGNLRSVWRALNRAGVAATVASDAASILAADKLVLPGVGNFGRAMSGLRRRGLIDALNEAGLVKRRPVLGICLGLELMAKGSEESRTAGLGWLDSTVVRFRPRDNERFKVPFIGWNGLTKTRESELLKGLNGVDEFYFLHSYYLATRDEETIVATTEYEIVFPAVIESDNLFGVQFHPERSHRSGEQVFRNFLKV